MPSVSKKQHNLMAAVANNPAFAKKVGIPRSVGEKFMKSDKGRKFREGGIMKKKMRKFEEGGETYLRDMAKRYGERPSKLDQLRADIKATGRAGMAAAKEAVGSVPQIRGAKELASRVRIPRSYEGEMGMKKGGMAKESKMMVKKEVEFMKKKGAPKSMIKHEMAEAGMKKGGMASMKDVAKKEVKSHEKRMHGMKAGGKVAQLSKADGVAKTGKSKGKMVKMAYGGKC